MSPTTTTDPTSLAEENSSLRARLATLEAELTTYRRLYGALPPPASPPPTSPPPAITPPSYPRYGRQMLLPELGLPGQLTLSTARVLIIGLGGLGSPCALYLASAGIGHLGLLDHDTTELSNLHRQTIHTTARIGTSKVQSAYTQLYQLNPTIKYTLHETALLPDNAAAIFSTYDLVVDCTDHPAVRYLISDTAVANGIPVVSASALRGDGQLVVLNNPPGTGPCYRCIWPIPPPASAVVSCGEGGVLGPVVGAMGVLQALEVVKVLLGRGGQKMLVFSAWAETIFRCVRIRGRRPGCVACDAPAGTAQDVKDRDYVRFCGGTEGVEKWEHRVGVEEARGLVQEGWGLVDVRDETQFGICKVQGSRNVPFERWENCEEGTMPEGLEGGKGKVVVVCRLGNDSQVVARRVKEAKPGWEVVDVVGGIAEWARRCPEDGVCEY